MRSRVIHLVPMHAGCFFTGFSAPVGAAIFMDSTGAQKNVPTLSLENCTISGNAVTSSPEYGAAIFSVIVPVLLNGTTFESNGANEIAVRAADVFTVGGPAESKIYFDPSNEIPGTSIMIDPDLIDGALMLGCCCSTSSLCPAGHLRAALNHHRERS
jgi:hypothetical protein